MSKESVAVCHAYFLGRNNRAAGKPYKNPFNKNKERYKHLAYRSGYYE